MSSSSSSSASWIPLNLVPIGGPDYGIPSLGIPSSLFPDTSIGGTGSGGYRFENSCDCPPCLPPGTTSGSGGVGGANGMVVLTTAVNLQTNGFRFPFGTQMQYENLHTAPGWRPVNGLGGLSIDVPTGRVTYKEGVNSLKVFLPTANGNYQPTYFVRDRLFWDATNSVYKLTSAGGMVQTFYDSGKLKTFQNPGGLTGTATYTGGGDIGDLATVSMTVGTDTWQFTYTWASSRIQSVIFTINSVNVRKLDYAYDGAGNLLTLKAYAYSGAGWGGTPVEAARYSYHASTNLLRHVITPTGYRQMVNNYLNPDAASEADLNAYAETEYFYDANKRVQTMYTHGRSYTYAFTYTAQSQSNTSLNVWTLKTEVAQSPYSQPVVSTTRYYFNRGGQVILQQVSAVSPAKTWNVFYQKFQEDTGRLILSTDASGIASVVEATPTLVTLQSTAEKIKTFAYDGNGLLYQISVQKGQTGGSNLLQQFTYTSRGVLGQGTIYVPIANTLYRGDGGTLWTTVTYSYSWHTSVFQMSQRVTTLPVVPITENGTGTAVVFTENFDTSGYLTSEVDGAGKTTSYSYSKVRDSLVQRIEDSGVGGLGLTTDYQVDDLGRRTRELGPAHDISLSGVKTNIRRAQWSQYLDEAWENRTFGGYQATVGSVDQIVGPVSIVELNDPPPTGYTGYRQVSRTDATYTTPGIPSPGAAFTQGTWVRRTIELYNKGDQLKEEWKYFLIPASGNGTQSTNYGKRMFGYDSAGRLNETMCAGGTIDKTTFNAMSWPVAEELGTSAGLTTTKTFEYNDSGGVTKVTLVATTNRVTDKSYDYRNRLIEDKTTVEKDGGGTWTLYTTYDYDNRDQVRGIAQYKDSVLTANRTGYRSLYYDAMGRRYRQEVWGVGPDGLGAQALTDNLFFDADGRVVREALGGTGLNTVTVYDAVGQIRTVYKACGIFSSSDPTGLGSATVVEQLTNEWDRGGNLISTMKKVRFEAASGFGPLNSASSEPKARVSYIAFYPDPLGRQQAAADYGTAATGSPPVPPNPWTRPDTVPTRSDVILVTSQTFDLAGNLATSTDPDAKENRPAFDAADRITTLVENYQASPGTDTRTTRFEYTDDGWLKKLKSDNVATGQQITEWIYGVTPAQGSALYSNRLVYQKKYPDSTGATDVVTYKYNQQLEVIGMTDQAGTVHVYTYDTLARLLADTVTTFGGAVNQTLFKLDNGYNERGLLTRATSYNTSGGTKANEVTWVYNDFNQPITEYQEHNGAVNTATSLKVQYSYANGAANSIRPTGITAPGGTAISIEYTTTMADLLSRPNAVKEGAATLATFGYLGLTTMARLKYDGASNAEFSLQNGGTGEAGDVYTGLDRFGRLVETLWKTGATELVHTTYGRNRASGVKWKRDVLAHAQSPANLKEDHFYWYDGLQQVKQHQRGDLVGTPPNYTGITNTQQDEVFTFDETGNWAAYSYTTPTPALSQTRIHNKANEIFSFSAPSGVPAPVYDGGSPGPGNMTTTPKVGAWTTGCALAWDAWNRLVSYNDGATTTYKYDALTRRISKTTTTETRDFYFDKRWRCIEERVGASIKAHYTWHPNDRWTLLRRKRSVTGTLDEVRFVLKDYLDPAAIVTTAGTVDERYSYDAFGPYRLLTPTFGARTTSSCEWNFLFHAEFRDQESGLYNYGYRYLHAALGRWLRRDPLAERGGYNLFRFAMNQPTRVVDILGLSTIDVPTLAPQPKYRPNPGRNPFGPPPRAFTEWTPKVRCSCTCSNGVYKLHYRMTLNPEIRIRSDEKDRRGAYGHEQRHILSGWQKAMQELKPKMDVLEKSFGTDKAACEEAALFCPGARGLEIDAEQLLNNTPDHAGQPGATPFSPEDGETYNPLPGTYEVL